MDSNVKMSPIHESDYHITLEEFIENCRNHWFIDYDGFGKLATATEVSNINISPSEYKSKVIDPMFTHVVWYNK